VGSLLLPAAAETPAFLAEIVGLLVGSAVIAYVAYRARLVPIIGFLLAGVVIGPEQLGLIGDRELVDAAAEIGVILLLFTIGLEFSLERLGRIRRIIFVGGGLQVGLATAATTAILVALGVEWRTAVFTGLLVSLSSTAIVLKLLGDRSQINRRHGQVSLGVLLFQDLAIVLMVLIVPALGGQAGSPGEFLWALAKAGLIVAGVILIARRLMPPLLEMVARTCSPEVFLLTVVAICFGTAYGTSLAGVSVSLGAFLAGLLVSESRFDQQALGEILPLQIIFSAMFFVSVGALLDVGFLIDHLPAVVGAVLAVLAVKAVTTGLAVRALGERTPVVLATALILAQVGEFSFVLERAGASVGLSPAGLGEDGAQGFIAATVLLMVATPWLSSLGTRTGHRLKVRQMPQPAAPGTEPEEGAGLAEDLDGHVIVCGYGRSARTLTAALQSCDVPLVVTTLSPDGAAEAQARGLTVLLGDATRTRTLLEAGLMRARIVIVPDDTPEMAARIAGVARGLNAEIKVVVRGRYTVDAAEPTAVGAWVVVEEAEADARLIGKLLNDYELPADKIEGVLTSLREPGKPREVREAFRGRTVVDTDRLVEPRLDPEACPHVGDTRPVVPSASGCEDCLREGTRWVHLRICMTCGHVGCCDSSPRRHARAHFVDTGHPIIRTVEPGEDWAYCFVDDVPLESAEEVPAPAPAGER
jgi:CPA2 family monovalent cation:H+ antiporter-2